TQPSTVSSLATSTLGAAAAGAGVAAADVAVWGGATEPVTSLGAAGAARSLSTASPSLASLAAGSVTAFSSLSRRSLVLLNWLTPNLEVCSTSALSATISASIRAIEASSALLADEVPSAAPTSCPTPEV